MTKAEAVATITRDLAKLSEEETRQVMEHVEYLASGKTFYESAPQYVRDSVQEGLEDLRAGRVHSSNNVFAGLDAIIAKTKA